ncbi:Hypothetical predicted protein [Olea europaea subsp. europaea]|uniref:Uncharacterized protein n=1 Tax=Olea europaea subsp. europaea TaxID=158383 RepID=A0A8S0PDP0_OLEEU|nr:Hypothetical predicted protein [Olea europaea subsp. europaea]
MNAKVKRASHIQKIHFYDILQSVFQEERLGKEYEYFVERANEQQLPKDTPLEKIHVDDPDAKINIMISVLGMKPERQILRLGDGRLREIGISSSNLHKWEKELEVECAARKCWHHSIQQLCGKFIGFIAFIPLSVENNGNGKDDALGDEENNFGENQHISNSRE